MRRFRGHVHLAVGGGRAWHGRGELAVGDGIVEARLRLLPVGRFTAGVEVVEAHPVARIARQGVRVRAGSDWAILWTRDEGVLDVLAAAGVAVDRRVRDVGAGDLIA